jgi:hypothetical protein
MPDVKSQGANDNDENIDAKVRRVASEEDVDERSVWKRLGGGRLRPKVERRVDRGLARCGLAPPHHDSAAPPAAGGE